jgi:hypothetical protein
MIPAPVAVARNIKNVAAHKGPFFYRQVPRKPRLVGGDESAQLKNNKIGLSA